MLITIHSLFPSESTATSVMPDHYIMNLVTQKWTENKSPPAKTFMWETAIPASCLWSQRLLYSPEIISCYLMDCLIDSFPSAEGQIIYCCHSQTTVNSWRLREPCSHITSFSPSHDCSLVSSLSSHYEALWFNSFLSSPCNLCVTA